LREEDWMLKYVLEVIKQNLSPSPSSPPPISRAGFSLV